MTKAGVKVVLKIQKESEVQRVLCIYYFVQLNEFSVEAYIDSDNEVNTVQPSFLITQGICICKTNVNTQKVDGSGLEIYEIVIVLF